ncbi:MAG TPA: thermonuclease family protein [Baekduia sp.]|uniref:thermonuclease family protein n=1 Tax=Baekduia sp. TaxID=2600305 RepID=UPI002CD3E8D2|nr:thermonuclease family protein [Baekduia sp.]HMJ36730.1 thermonuclease family protein [Baekduia sp.]
MRRALPWILVVLLAAGYGLGRGAGGSPDSRAGSTQTARVLRVVDGDTILVALGGKTERVRYIGMDTPETVKPRAPVQCFGKKASAANEQLVDGRAVRLVADAEARDRYGRMLAYVYRASDGVFVNAELVRRGYARPLRIAPNVRYAARFRALARDAQRARRGLWSACER